MKVGLTGSMLPSINILQTPFWPGSLITIIFLGVCSKNAVQIIISWVDMLYLHHF